MASEIGRRTKSLLLVQSEQPGWKWLRSVLTDVREMRIVGVVLSENQALALAECQRPDVILLCATVLLRSPPIFLYHLQAASPTSAIAVVGSRRQCKSLIHPRWELSTILSWEQLNEERLLAALVSAVSGIHAATLDILKPSMVERSLAALTAHESDVITGFWDELTENRIAETYAMSESTVSRTVEALKDRFGVRTLFKLGVLTERAGLHPHDLDL